MRRPLPLSSWSLGEVYHGLHFDDVRDLIDRHPRILDVLRDAAPRIREHFGLLRPTLALHRTGGAVRLNVRICEADAQRARLAAFRAALGDAHAQLPIDFI